MGNLITTQSCWRKMWADAHIAFGYELSSYVLHAYIALFYGKRSLRELTKEEVVQTIKWIDEFLNK